MTALPKRRPSWTITDLRKYTDPELIRKLTALVSEEALVRAMHAVGYFPPDTPPPVLTGADA